MRWLPSPTLLVRGALSCGLLVLALAMAVLPVMDAEILQVRTSSILQIGDHNRNYTVQLACVDVSPDDETAAVDFLRKALPRRQRVNLRPEGSVDGALVARVTPLGQDQDLTTTLVAAGLARPGCAPTT